MGSPPPPPTSRGEQLSCIRVIAFSPAFFLEQIFFNYYFIFLFFLLFFHILTTLRFIFVFFYGCNDIVFFSTSYTSNVHIHKAELPFKNKPVCDKAVTDAKYRSGSHSRTGLAAPVYSQ